jgi:hypothetical protein
MRLTIVLGAVALAALAAACETTTADRGAGCNPQALTAELQQIKDLAKAASDRTAYYGVLRGRYAQLSQIRERASVTRANQATAERIACGAIAAETAFIQSYLPGRLREGVAPAGSEPPAGVALEAARSTTTLCASGGEQRFCSIAKMIAVSSLPQDVATRLNDAAEEIIAGTFSDWSGARTQVAAFGEASARWKQPLDEAVRSGALSEQLARGYFEPIACSIVLDSEVLRNQPTSDPEGRRSFALDYLAAITRTSDALGLSLTPDGQSACTTAPTGTDCGAAHVAAMLDVCEPLWGLRPGGV